MLDDVFERPGAAVMEVLRVLPQPAQRSRAVRAALRAQRIRTVDTRVARRMQLVGGIVVGAAAADVAARTGPVEHFPAARGAGGIEAARGRRRSGEAVLVRAQR